MIDERNRSRFGKITVIYGARNPGLLIYKDELEAWDKRDDINLNVTREPAGSFVTFIAGSLLLHNYCLLKDWAASQ
jgi:NAD(P)H-flavin reductase